MIGEDKRNLGEPWEGLGVPWSQIADWGLAEKRFRDLGFWVQALGPRVKGSALRVSGLEGSGFLRARAHHLGFTATIAEVGKQTARENANYLYRVLLGG